MQQPRTRLTTVVAALIALSLPGAAHAHIRSGTVAVDARSTIGRLPRSTRSAVSVRIARSDLALQLTLHPNHRVLVLGYVGEAFLRFDARGVAANVASPTAAATGLLAIMKHAPQVGFWRVRPGRTLAWHDARIRSSGAGSGRRHWTIALVVDGTPRALVGDTVRVEAPPLWIWIAFGAPFAAAAMFVLGRRSQRARSAATAAGAVAGAAALVTAVGLAAAQGASLMKWVEGGDEALFAAIGLVVLALGRGSVRAISSGALGLLALFVGLTAVTGLSHGIILSALPTPDARVGIALALWAGALATVLSAALFTDVTTRLPQRDVDAPLFLHTVRTVLDLPRERNDCA